jgi:TolB-like protein
MKIIQSVMITALFVMLFPLPAPAVEGIQTLAILPFDNNSITEPEKYAPLSNGLAAMLITDLNKNEAVLTVIERNKIKSILKEIALGQLGGVDQSTAIEAGKILGAQSIGFGSFTIMGDMIRIDVRIIKVESSELVMAESVSGETKNFMTLETELATKIANALKTSLKELPGKSKSSIDAALYFSKGIDAMDKGKKKEAQKFFNKAIELDPTYKIQVQAIN